MGEYDPFRITFQVLRFKDWQWIQNVANQNYGNQLHCRQLHVWRWERPLYKFFETRPESWGQIAVDEQEWHRLLDEMVEW